MSDAEGRGPSPEESGENFVAPETGQIDTPQPESAPNPVETPEQPTETKPSLRDRISEKVSNFREKIRDKKERAEVRRNLDKARERRIKGYAEVIKHGARTPQQLQDMLADISFKDLKEAQERNKYGSGAVGKLKAFLAGETDQKINDDESVTRYYDSLNTLRQELGREPNKQEHAERMGITPEQLDEINLIGNADILKEAGRRLLSTFANRRTAVSAVMYLAMGALTGGFGWAAGGVLLGGAAGRGVAEMGELFAGKTREARQDVLYAEKARWERMQALALQIRSNGEDAVSQGSLTKELVDMMYRQGDNVLVRNLAESEKELAKREEKFNKIRSRLQTAGELVGAVAGVTSVLNGGVEHIDMDFFGKVDGQSVFHGVQQTQDGWQFLYSSGAEAGAANSLGATILASGQFGAHALEATTSQIIAYTIAERTLPMLLASGLAGGAHKKNGELLAKMGGRKLNPDYYYDQPGPDGSRIIYSREEDGSYKRWEWQETEEKDGEKTKKVRKLVGQEIDENDVPSKFKERFVNLPADQQSRNAEHLTNQMSDYIRSVADVNHNPVPESPREHSYNWNERPRSIDTASISQIDHWYQFVNANGQDQPRLDPVTGRLVEVAVLGVDVINNRIAYARFERADNGAEHVPIEVMRLDDFLKGFHLHGNPKSGASVESAHSNDAINIEDDSSQIIDAEFTDIEQPDSSASKNDASSSPETQPSQRPNKPENRNVPNTPKRDSDPKNKDIEKEFLDAFGGDGGTKDAVKTNRETIANKESRPRFEAMKLPKGYEDMNRSERFNWITDVLSQLGEEITEASNVYYGASEGNGKSWEYVRFQEANGKEHILNKYLDKSGDRTKSHFEIIVGRGDNEWHSPYASKHSLETFTRLILRQINEAVRTGKAVPKTEFQPIEPHEKSEGPISDGRIPLVAEGGQTKIKRKESTEIDDADSRLKKGFKHKKDDSSGDELEELNDLERDEAVVEEERPATPVATRGGEFDASIGTRVPGLEGLRDKLKEAEESRDVVTLEPAQETVQPKEDKELSINEKLAQHGKTLEDFKIGASFKLRTDLADQADASIVEDIFRNLMPQEDQANKEVLERLKSQDITFEVYGEPDPDSTDPEPENYLITFIADDTSGKSVESSLPLSKLLDVIKE